MIGRRLDDGAAPERALFRPHTPQPPAGGGGPSGPIRLTATEYGRGPWDAGLLHGGAVVGVAAWAVERVILSTVGPTVADRAAPAVGPSLCARLTVELLRPVPCRELVVTATPVRIGRRVAVVDAAILDGNDGVTVLARASSQWVAPAPGWDGPGLAPPPRPIEPSEPWIGELTYPRPGFNCDVAELRYVSGSNEQSGPAIIWARLTSPIVAGEVPSPFLTVATLADLAAAAGFERGPADEAFINPDLTLQLSRPPRGEWVALDARTHRSSGRAGFNEAIVFDDDGPIGRVLQSLVESPLVPGQPSG